VISAFLEAVKEVCAVGGTNQYTKYFFFFGKLDTTTLAGRARIWDSSYTSSIMKALPVSEQQVLHELYQCDFP
jgi:hypothetical protein